MNERFVPSVHFVLQHECVYEAGHDGDLNHVVSENVPGDSGGVTKYGIDQASHPHVSIRNLTLEEAIMIYRTEEWTKCRCGDLPAGLDTAVFDCAVNMGKSIAIKYLQRALNNVCSTFLVIDGQIGPKTVMAASNCSSSAKAIAAEHIRLREIRYHDLAATPARAKFLRGWLNRLRDLSAFIGIVQKEEAKA